MGYTAPLPPGEGSKHALVCVDAARGPTQAFLTAQTGGLEKRLPSSNQGLLVSEIRMEVPAPLSNLQAGLTERKAGPLQQTKSPARKTTFTAWANSTCSVRK